jgi:hypothetical protein
MKRKQKIKLIYNVTVMVIALLIGFYTYPSEWSDFFFLAAGIGFFFTLSLIVTASTKKE